MTSVKPDLRALVDDAAGRFEGADPGEVMSWAAGLFGDRLAIAASMQDGVVAHLASRFAPDTDVLFLDTGYHFPETIRTRHQIADAYGLRVIDVRPETSVAQQDAQLGPALHDRDPNLCCRLRKTDPLDEALRGYDAWITGVRRADSTRRATTPVISYDRRREIVKIAPLASWTDADIEDYIATHDILVNPLRNQGFPSIGCAPCTVAVAAGGDARSGRWAGLEKTECGIQL
jgi:phosphoadenosine phosphosulfate reductase